MKTKENTIQSFDKIHAQLKKELKEFFETTDFSGNDIALAIGISRQSVTDLKAFLFDKSDRPVSAERMRNTLETLYNAKMIK